MKSTSQSRGFLPILKISRGYRIQNAFYTLLLAFNIFNVIHLIKMEIGFGALPLLCQVNEFLNLFIFLRSADMLLISLACLQTNFPHPQTAKPNATLSTGRHSEHREGFRFILKIPCQAVGNFSSPLCLSIFARKSLQIRGWGLRAIGSKPKRFTSTSQ